jgi:hypothetical protein
MDRAKSWALLNLTGKGVRVAQGLPQPLAIRGQGMIGSIWPVWVILFYLVGVELTVE